MTDTMPEMGPELKRMLAEHNEKMVAWRKRHPVTSETVLDGDSVTGRNYITTYYRDGKMTRVIARERTVPYRPPLAGKWLHTYDPKTGQISVEKVSD
jgi:hypothetical protein